MSIKISKCINEGLEETSKRDINQIITIILEDDNDKKFEVKVGTIKVFNVIDVEMEQDMEATEIPMRGPDAETFSKILEFIEIYKSHDEVYVEVEHPLKSKNLYDVMEDWAAKFILDCDINLVYKIIAATDKYDFFPLLNISCVRVASEMMNKSTEEMRDMFGLKCDLTDDEIKAIKEENKIN